MKFEPQDRSRLVDAAMGRKKCDYVIRNVNLINVFTEEIYPAEVGIYEGFIAHVIENPAGWTIEANKIIDGKGQYLVPGFIDPHIHIESTMMTPRNFANAVIPLGTTTVVTDPHEAVNVRGLDAIRYMSDSMKGVPLRHFILAPSCVPALPGFENAGFTVEKEQIEQMLDMDSVIGLAEVMDFPGVINNSKRMRDLIDSTLARGLFIQGHALGVSGRSLSAYLCGGPVSDHETSSPEEVIERLRKGMHVDAKESTFVSNVKLTVEAASRLPTFPRNLSFCTDDREPDGIQEEGHMNHVVNVAIGAGMAPIQAIICATLNPARELGFENLGAITPGYAADLLLVPELKNIHPSMVIAGGSPVAENGEMLSPIPPKNHAIERADTINTEVPQCEDLRIKVDSPAKTVQVNVLHHAPLGPNDFLEIQTEEIPVTDGYLDISRDPGLKYITVVNRYGLKKKAIALVRNFPLLQGAIAGSIAHDSHNLICVFETPEEAELALKEVIASKGGLVAVNGEKVLGKLELPIFGLMSTLALGELAEAQTKLMESARELAVSNDLDIFIEMAIIALPVRPWASITDEGLFDLKKMQTVPVVL